MSVGVEYAFHSLFYMIDAPTGCTIGIKELAELNKLPETYLSKIFTKLRKSGIVRSIQGVKGGYELSKQPKDISFWDIVEAVEGASYMFQCAEIRQNNILSEPNATPSNCPCLIKVVMLNAEDEMRKYLKNKSLDWLHKEVHKDFSDEKKAAISGWLDRAIKSRSHTRKHRDAQKARDISAQTRILSCLVPKRKEILGYRISDAVADNGVNSDFAKGFLL